MGKIFFTGDLHFGHANVIAFDNRPFKTVEEMDAELIRRWNNKVGKGDLTYVLGDMIWKARNDDAPELIKSLNGQIILIKGNHDRFLHNAKAKAALAGIKDYDDICVSLEDGTKKRVILSIISPRCTTDIDTRQSISMLIPILLMKRILRLILRSVLIASDAGMKFTM